jgi:hypothetical protein
MEILVLTGLVVLPLLSPRDPGPGLLRSKKVNERLMCDRLSTEDAQAQFPGRVRPTAPRGDFIERSAVVCRERIVRPGLRSKRDEAVLQSLADDSEVVARTAASLRPELADATWMVDVFYPSAQVSPKIAFAHKNALLTQGLRVSDRTPVLSAGDVDVLLRMEPALAYPAACVRWHATGALDDDDVLLAVVNRDPRATVLHAGLCANGAWTWLR